MQLNLNRQYNLKQRIRLIDIKGQMIGKVLLHMIVFGVFFLYVIQQTITSNYSSEIYENIDDVEQYEYAIVIATTIDQNSDPEKMLRDRALTAVDLYKQGKVQRILLMGNDDYLNFDEVEIMMEVLKDKGIPDFVISKDVDIYRTYDACFNAKKNFKVNNAIIVTQKFHLLRSVYTCNSLGIDSVGMIADRSIYPDIGLLEYRERLALIKAWLDLSILRPHQ